MVSSWRIKLLVSVCSYVLSALSHCVGAMLRAVCLFDAPVSACAERICQLGHMLKKTAYSFSIGSGSGESMACYGFISLRHSLDASHA